MQKMYTLTELLDYMWRVESEGRTESKPVDDLTKESE